jgi:broad specificity phosphatase PhoE
MAVVLLARHGETDWNRERRWQGQTDTPLNDTGRRQAEELAVALDGEPIAAIYASDLARARETAEIVAARLELPVRADPRLREVDVGDWAGLPVDLREDERPLDVFAADRHDAFAEMVERVTAALREIARAHDGERVLIVTHGGPIAAAWLASGGALGGRPVVGNCHVQAIRVEGERITGID